MTKRISNKVLAKFRGNPYEFLYKKYIEEGLSIFQIADIAGVSSPIVQKGLAFFKIKKPMSSVRKKCDWCHKRITVEKNRLSQDHFFCSYFCSRTHRRLKGKTGQDNPIYKKVQSKCPSCEKIYPVELSRIKRRGINNVCCSKKCDSIRKVRTALRGEKNPMYKRVVRVCLGCGSQIHAHVHRAKRAISLFCSLQCRQGHYMKNPKKDSYGLGWERASRDARIRDNNTCQACGEKSENNGRSMDVHHIIKFGFFGVKRSKEAHSLSNLISYCNRCHTKIESETNSILDRIDPKIAKALYAPRPQYKHILTQSQD